MSFTVYGAAGSGSVPIEAALTLMDLPYTVVEAATWEGDEARARVAPVNPLRQVPAIVLPSGEVMTESAAILLWLGDSYPESGLAPSPGDPLRARYLRWMVYLPAAIYPMYWVRDEPGRLADGPGQEQVILARTRERIAECWRAMEAQIEPGQYLLGDRLTLLDLYVAVMSRWSPRRTRFYREAPRMGEVVRRVDAEARLARFWAERFAFDAGWEGPA